MTFEQIMVLINVCVFIPYMILSAILERKRDKIMRLTSGLISGLIEEAKIQIKINVGVEETLSDINKRLDSQSNAWSKKEKANAAG